jgi:uncharacterized membrane protein YqjE
MSASDRSVSDVLQDIIGNIQEIVRSEVRLAKFELREEASRAKAAGVLLGAGGVTAGFAVLFLLVAAVYALSLVVPNWAAALIVAAVLGIAAAVILSAGMQRVRRVHPAPERTVETLKENVEWAKQQTK